MKALPDPSSDVNRLCEYLNLNEPQLEQTEYILQFLSIPCSVTKLEKQRLLRNHKSKEQKQKKKENNKRNYKCMRPIKKKVLNESKAMIYRAMSPSEKEVYDKRNRENKKIKYKQMDHIEKRTFSEK